MTTAHKIFFVPVIIAALTAFGLEATTLAQRNPSPVANIGDTLELPFAFTPYDGKPLND